MNWTALGQHRYRIEDDVLAFETVGDFTTEHLLAMGKLQSEVVARYGYALFFINNLLPGALSPAARRVAIENNRHQMAPWSMALIGFEGSSGVVARAAVLLAARAIRLLTSRKFFLEFFSTEEQARSWLDVQRQRHRDELRGHVRRHDT